MSGDPAAASTGHPGSGHVAGDGGAGHGEAGDGGAGHGDAGHGDAGQAGWKVPWAGPPTGETQRPERAELELAFANALRGTGSLMTLMTQAAADRIGINATDLNCLNILSFRGHMTAGELARETGLTTASITGVVDRLEEAGYVTRERDPHDRRRVVVKLVLDRAMRDVATLFLPMMRAWRQMAARYSDDELRLIVEYYARVEQVLRQHLARLRDTRPADPPSGESPGSG